MFSLFARSSVTWSCLSALAIALPAAAQRTATTTPPALSRSVQVSSAQLVTRIGGFTPANAGFGGSVAAIGDLDDDGHADLAVTAGGQDLIYVLFLEGQRVRALQTIPDSIVGGYDDYGHALCALGDVDGNGVEDLAVSQPTACRVWILFMNADGTVASTRRTSDGLPPPSIAGVTDSYGEGLAGLGDFDGDGIRDMLIASGTGSDGGNPRFFVTFLHANGTVKGLFANGAFSGGLSCAALGDLDGNGRREIAIGEAANHNRARVYELNANGSTQATAPVIQGTHYFGHALAGTHDVDHDGVPDMVVGAPLFASFRGAAFRVLLNADGSEKARTLIAGPGGNPLFLGPSDRFGGALAFLGDVDGDAVPEIAVGAAGDDRNATNAGAVWIFGLE